MATMLDPTPAVDWIDRDRHVSEGLDQLGIQVVSASLYGQLLPGITNVTDRARYFSFYPWILHSFAQQAKPTDGRLEWLTWFRSLEYAYAAVCAAWEDENGEATAVVGVDAARKALRKSGAREPIDLLKSAQLNAEGKVPAGAYFKNPEGGFGQYYKVSLTTLGLMQEDRQYRYPDRRLTRYAGERLASAADSQFRELLNAAGKRVSVADLSRLGEKVGPAAITPDSDEETLLRALFMGDDDNVCQGQPRDTRLARRASLRLILRFLSDCAEPVPAYVDTFRWACSAAALPGHRSWQLDRDMETTRRQWAAYHDNDLMNVALETFLWLGMRRLENRPALPRSLAQAVVNLIREGASSPLKGIATARRVGDWIESSARPSPESIDTTDPNATRTWSENLLSAVDDQKDAEAAGWAARILGRLGGPRRNDEVPISAFGAVGDVYEVHRDALRARVERQRAESFSRFMEQLVLEWVIYRHLRVATRKLANQGVSTFKFRPEEGRLIDIADRTPEPGLTSPRLRQAFRILADLHFVELGDAGATLTEHGRALVART